MKQEGKTTGCTGWIKVPKNAFLAERGDIAWKFSLTSMCCECEEKKLLTL
jgi:hypothetical protein